MKSPFLRRWFTCNTTFEVTSVPLEKTQLLAGMVISRSFEKCKTEVTEALNESIKGVLENSTLNWLAAAVSGTFSTHTVSFKG